MATISSPGIGSGLDTAGIVSKLMAVEATPLNQLTKSQDSYQTKITAYGQVQSSLSQFQSSVLSLSNINTLKTVNATSSDTSILSATTSVGAVAGNYAITVNQLAQSQQLVSNGQSSSTAAIGSGSSTVTFDFGTISGTKTNSKYDTGTTFTSNGIASKSITIDSSNNTLSGIRDAINAAGMGVTASIINDGSTSPYRLLLTNNQTGVANSMRISVSGNASVSSLLSEDPANPTGQNFQETTAAQNANLTISGVAVTKASNVITDAISGVTMTLNKTNVGSTVNLNLTNNSSGLGTSITNLVSSYNSLNTSLKSLTSYDLTTRKGADLYGETTITAIQRQIKNVVLSALPAGSNSYTVLNNIGITFQKDGSLAVDNMKLNNAISSNYSAVANLFAANATASDSLIQFTSSTSDTAPGSYPVNVSTMPTQGKLIAGAAPSSLTIGAGNNSLAITLNGTASTIQLTNATYANISDLAASVQAQINGTSAFTNLGASISVTADGTGKLNFVSNRYGGASSVALSGDASSNLLGGTSGTSTTGLDMVATLNGASALTSGQFLLGPLNTPQSGLKLQVIGGTTGARGSVTYTKGVAYQLNQLINSLSGTNGLITTRTTGLNTTIKQIESQKTQMQAHLNILQKQYQSIYSALDTTMATLNSTSTYLTGQLSSIAATSNSIASRK
ncbi:flagellar hook-associated protein 2 [Polynucleobacter sp. SHI8]|uniref:flagellar filament capping protein FliD n=1 Tax=unclassified Polynucleobacter TaxID=2640945 RepID=UPI0024928E9D|nr:MULTISPECIES: flagellar filament capping protein FliD [unclassified Polynucleobacter]BDW11748.1 flagellar hook-associated protein 2 [Polynucleobacter sp. SHI2]BDW14195.1 flagellar hook-associated protein 2 [Polynucleobacter sp. SHI8]